MKRMSTGKVILVGSLILAVFIMLPLLYNHFFEIKPKILPPLVQKKEVSIIGITVVPPDEVTFYTDGIMTDVEKKLMVESFLTAVVIPEKDLWVNLRVNQQNSIAQFYLGRTELGRVMLEQDLLLKRATSTAYYPEREPGNTFWSRISMYGNTRRTASEIRSWIFPKQVVIKDNGREMFIKSAELDVRQERIQEGIGGFQDASDELILPAVKKYVLYDEHFIPTRQVFRAVVCGIWFKNKFLRTIYTYYINTNKTGYFEIADSNMKYKVWDKYIQSFKDKDYLDADAMGNRVWGGIEFKNPRSWIKAEKIASSPVRNEVVKATLGKITETKELARLFNEPSFDYLSTMRTQALNILGNVLKEEGINLRQDLHFKAMLVTKQLFLRPDYKSQDIAYRFNINVTELREIYKVIKLSPTLQGLIVDESKYSRLVEYTTKYLLKYTDTLEKSFNNQIVYPLIVEWHPGETCNSDCVFCYNKGLQYAERGKQELLEIEKSKQLIQEWADNDVKEFWVSGGKEPLTNPTTADVIKYATDKGLLVKLYTNGINLVSSIQPKLLGAKWVRISLNAATPETYHTVQGIKPEYFDRVRNNIRELVNLRNKEGSHLNIGMSFLVNPWNYQEILQAADNASKLGVNFLAFNTDIAGMVRRYTPEEIDKIILSMETLKANQEAGVYGKLNIDIRALTREELSGEKQLLPDMEQAKYCEMKVIKANMNPYGVFHLCDYAGQPINERTEVRVGDINVTSFREMLHSLIGIKFETTKCNGCLIRESGFNIILEKLRADRLFGIPLTEQPYLITYENGVEFLSKRKDNITEGLSELKDKDTITFQVKPSTMPNSVNTETSERVTPIGGIDFNTRIEVEEDTFPISDIEAREWQLSESIGYDLLK